MIERESGAPGAAPHPRLARHLRECAECAAEEQLGARLARELASLRTAPPFEIDVVARVRAGLEAPRQRRRAFPALDPRTLSWLAAGVMAVASTLVWGARHVPVLRQGVGQAWTMAAVFGRITLVLLAVFGRTLEATGSALARWFLYLTGALPELALGVSLERVALWAALVMTLLTLGALVRDLKRRNASPSKG